MRGQRSAPRPTAGTVLRRLDVEIARLERVAAILIAAVERLAAASAPPQRLDITGLSAQLTVEFRVCSRCGVLKPIEEFYPRPDQHDPERRHRQCSDCMSTALRARRAAPSDAEVSENLTGERRLRRSRTAASRSAPNDEPSAECRKI